MQGVHEINFVLMDGNGSSSLRVLKIDQKRYNELMGGLSML